MFQVFLLNIDNNKVLWFQVFLSHTNNLYTIIWLQYSFKYFLFNINNQDTIMRFQVIFSNTNN